MGGMLVAICTARNGLNGVPTSFLLSLPKVASYGSYSSVRNTELFLGVGSHILCRDSINHLLTK